VLVFEAGRLEGLVEQGGLVLDMVLYTVFVLLDMQLIQLSSSLALALSKLRILKTITA